MLLRILMISLKHYGNCSILFWVGDILPSFKRIIIYSCLLFFSMVDIKIEKRGWVKRLGNVEDCYLSSWKPLSIVMSVVLPLFDFKYNSLRLASFMLPYAS
jgi:hypothetical protein